LHPDDRGVLAGAASVAPDKESIMLAQKRRFFAAIAVVLGFAAAVVGMRPAAAAPVPPSCDQRYVGCVIDAAVKYGFCGATLIPSCGAQYEYDLSVCLFKYQVCSVGQGLP